MTAPRREPLVVRVEARGTLYVNPCGGRPLVRVSYFDVRDWGYTRHDTLEGSTDAEAER